MLNNIVTSPVHIYRGFFATTRVKRQTMMKSIICIWFLYCKHTHLKINLHVLFITSQSGDKPFAAWHSCGTKPPCWDPKVALGQDQQKAYIFFFSFSFLIFFVCLVPVWLLLPTMAVFYHAGKGRALYHYGKRTMCFKQVFFTLKREDKTIHKSSLPWSRELPRTETYTLVENC